MTKEEVLEWAFQMEEQGAVVIDTETTGGSFQDEVIEVSAVRAKDGVVLFDSLFHPKRPVCYHSTKVHGFRTRDLIGNPRFPDKWTELFAAIDGVPLLAFNSAFDKRMIIQSCKKYDIEPPESEWHCIMQNYGKYVGRRTGVSLASVCAELEIPGGNHRALTDAIAAARIVNKLTETHLALQEDARLEAQLIATMEAEGGIYVEENGTSPGY